MKSIKYTILLSFCSIAIISIAVLAVIVSWRIQVSMSQQSEELAANLSAQTYNMLDQPHQTFELLVREDIRRVVREISQNPMFIAEVEKGRISALNAALTTTAGHEQADCALLLNPKGQVQAAFPVAAVDEFAVEEWLRSWNFWAAIQEGLQQEEDLRSKVWETFVRSDTKILTMLGVHAYDIEGKGALSLIAASAVVNDFGELLGVALVVKVLNGYTKPLEWLNSIASYASVVYLDTLPIAAAGFSQGANLDQQREAFALHPDVHQAVLATPDKRIDRVLNFSGTPYLSACSALLSFAYEAVGTLCVGLPEANITAAQQAILTSGATARKDLQRVIVVVGFISVGFFVLVSLVVATRIVTPLKQLSRHARQIASGDFRETVEVLAQNELGDLSRSLHAVSTAFRDVSRTAEAIAAGNLSHAVQLRSESDSLGRALQAMSAYLRDMASLTEQIARGDLTGAIHIRSADDVLGHALQVMTEGLHALIGQAKQSVAQLLATRATISDLAVQNIGVVEDVHSCVEQMNATMHGMGMSVEDVSQNMDTLSTSMEETATSVTQMATSMKHIATNTTNLNQHAQQVSADIMQTLQSLEQIVASTDTSQQLAQETMQDAREGQQAVEQVMASMQTIQQTITMAIEAITHFAQQSQEITTILDVIRDITEQTSLLALNASIIAAQAGSHGRGFAVVADEIKTLSTRVNASTKDIAVIVRALQQDTERVVQSVHDGANDVNLGMERTRQAQHALNKITASAERSSGVVAEIADALNGLMSISRTVSSAMEHVYAMTEDIMAATKQHNVGTTHIHDAISQITDMTSQIQHATTIQLTGIRQVLETTQHLSDVMANNLDSSQRIVAVTHDLSAQATILSQSVDLFRLDTGDPVQPLEP